MLKKIVLIMFVVIFCIPNFQAFAFTNISNITPSNQETITTEFNAFLPLSNLTSDSTNQEIDSMQKENKSVTEPEQRPIDVIHPELNITPANALHITIFVLVFIIIAAATVFFLVRSGK